MEILEVFDPASFGKYKKDQSLNILVNKGKIMFSDALVLALGFTAEAENQVSIKLTSTQLLGFAKASENGFVVRTDASKKFYITNTSLVQHLLAHYKVDGLVKDGTLPSVKFTVSPCEVVFAQPLFLIDAPKPYQKP
jgi:hypothetical protein